MLQWIRRAKNKKRFRTLMIIGIVVLSFGLVGSYAIWSVPRFNSSQAGSSAPADSTADYEQMEKRIAEIEQSVAQKKDDPELLENLANAYYDLGFQMFTDGSDAKKAQENLNSALLNYEAVLKITPDNIPVTLQAAYTSWINGNVEKAEGFYKKALGIDPKAVDTKISYGQFLLYGKNDFEGAKKQWQEALSLNPDADTKTNLQGLMDQADQLKDYQEKAAKEAEKAAKESKKDKEGN